MRYSLFSIFLFSLQCLMAQHDPIPADLPQFGFIRYNNNHFELVQDNPDYQNLFNKFDNFIRTGDSRIKIVHIGGSHIQADIYTHRIRQEMQSFFPGILGARGFFFPYRLAKTNTPSNLGISYTGEWETNKNTQPATNMPLGLSGITVKLTSDSGSLSIVARYDTLVQYDFNRVRLFCNTPLSGVVPEVYPQQLVDNITVHPAGSYIEYNLRQYTDTLHLRIVQPDSSATAFQLYGISLENDDPGVVYNTIGVNGAMLKSYLRCDLFGQQLKVLEPDWVIISIGTNEGNTRTFNGEAYRTAYVQFIDSIKKAAPGAAILLTVPNDSYLFKRYVNHNTARIREIIYDIARSTGCGVYDFYTVMGGLNSATAWYNSGLMSKDHIHFNKPGYLLKGDLFFSAFLSSWGEHLQHPLTPVQTPKLVPLSHTSLIQQQLQPQ